MQAPWTNRYFLICVCLWPVHSVSCKRDIDIVLEHDLNGKFVKGGRIFGTLNPIVCHPILKDCSLRIKLHRSDHHLTDRLYKLWSNMQFDMLNFLKYDELFLCVVLTWGLLAGHFDS